MTDLTSLPKTRKQQQRRLNSSTAGFTMVEVLVVVIMVGVLAVISGAGYISWLNRIRTNAARDVISNAIQEAQSRARQRHAIWQASFQETKVKGKTVVQWAIHPANTDPTWTNIEQSSIEIYQGNKATTLDTDGKPTGAWKIQFDHKGQVYVKDTPTGRITLSTVGGTNKRCVEVKTILGAMGRGQDDDCTK